MVPVGQERTVTIRLPAKAGPSAMKSDTTMAPLNGRTPPRRFVLEYRHRLVPPTPGSAAAGYLPYDAHGTDVDYIVIHMGAVP